MTQTHVSEGKKITVKNMADLIRNYPIIGVVNMENMPAKQLQNMRAKLREEALILMTKKRLMKIAFEQVKNEKKGIEKLNEYLEGMPALIFTKDNPFKLSKTLDKSKSPAPAKAGQTAPKDLVVNAGPTPFAPGPLIGELSMLGIKAGVEGGKIAIKQDAVVVKKGEQIKPKAAEILTRLGIQPMEVGLGLVAVYEDGLIYTSGILSIDENEYINRISNAGRWAFNLAMYCHYPAKGTIEFLLGNAHIDAKTLGISQEIFDSGIIESLLGKAEMQMQNLRNTANIQVGDVKKAEPEEKKEELKPEEAKKEPKEDVLGKIEEKKPKPKEPEVTEIPAPKPEVKEEVIAKPEVEEKPEAKEEAKVELKPEVEEKPEAKEVKEKPKEEKKVPTAKELAEKKEEAKALSQKELEENIKKREKEKEMEEVEKLAREIARKHALGK